MQARGIDHRQDPEDERCGGLPVYGPPRFFSHSKQGDLIHTAYWVESPEPWTDTVLDDAGKSELG